MKTGPCGIYPAGAASNLQGGSLRTVVWQETIDHSGYMRLAFSRTGFDHFGYNIIFTNLPDTYGDAGTKQVQLIHNCLKFRQTLLFQI